MERPWKTLACCAMALGCSDAAPEVEAEGSVRETREPVYYDAGEVWDDPSISVCWTSSDDATEREWVRNAVEDAFEPLSDVNFTGWETCHSWFFTADVVIDVSSDHWPAADLGGPSVDLNHFIGRVRDLDDDGDVDFEWCYTKLENGEPNPDSSGPFTGETGRHWDWSRKSCIEIIAVHEFAHVLGIDHEQSRPDTPATCTEPADEDSDGTEYGYWDITSVSNYCNPAPGNDGMLSPLDVAWLIDVYGKDTDDHLWLSFGNARDYGAPQNQMMFATEARDVSGDYKPETGDFNGDGRADILWYREGSGSDPIWWADPQGGFIHDTASPIDSTYRMATADFDGDGRTDIFMHAPGSVNDRVWFGRSNETFDSVVMPNITGSFVPIAGDFDDDGHGDVFLYAPGDGMDYLWWGRGDRSFSKEEAQENVTGTYVPLAGDFDGNHKADIFWYFPGGSDDERVWWGRSDRTFAKTNDIPNVSGTYSPTVGDYDGNGTSDILWSDGTESARDPLWLFKTSRGAFSDTRVAHVLRSKPFSGDFNGDGRADVFFYKAD